MKTTLPLHGLPRLPQALLLLLAATCMLTANTSAAKEPAKDEPKTHALYMGADFRIAYGQELYRVRNVAGDSFVIVVDGKEVRVPMKAGAIKLKIDQSLKLTQASAAIEQLQSERAYTIDNNPRHKWMENRAIAPGEISVGDVIDKNHDVINATPSTVMAPNGSTVVNPAYTAAQLNDQSKIAQQLSGLNSPGQNIQSMDEELARGLFDAIEVKFDVSAGKALKSPYVVFVAQYHAKDKPQSSQNWIYAQTLNPIENKPTHVRVLQGGFPLGFELEKFSIHLYDDGTEIATNVADNRVALTREEAFLYITTDYIGRHKGASLPASPAMVKLPGDWGTVANANSNIKTCFVSVDKTGHPVATFADNACTKKLNDAYVETVIMDTRFLPALAEGKPIASVAKLTLSDLSKYTL
jgi:hypothetical protein